MKKYISIENIRLKDVELSPEIIRHANISAFETGDDVVVQEKIDGSCASFRYLNNGKFVACSRRKVLDEKNNLDGFYQYCEDLAHKLWKNEMMMAKFNHSNFFDYDKFIIYGEWTGRRNQIIYKQNPMHQWFIFDIYDTADECLLDFEVVKIICEELDLTPVHEIARIKDFRTWNTILSMANTNYGYYGDMQEGIIIKNQTKLNSIKKYEIDKNPIYLKLVNKEYKEVKRTPNPEKIQQNKIMQEAIKEFKNVVQDTRILKCLAKLQEDGTIPTIMTNNDLPTVFKTLPRAVIVDVKKEEPELYDYYRKQANKAINKIVTNYIKNIIKTRTN